MSKVLPVVAFVALFAIGAGIDYAYFYTQQTLLISQNKPAYASYGDFVSQRFTSLSSTTEKMVLPSTTEKMALPVFLPPAPDGWQRRAYEGADGTLLTGRELLPTMLAVDDTNSLLQILRLPSVSGKRIVETYINDKTVVIVTLAFKKDRNSAGQKEALEADVSETMGKATLFDGEDSPLPFALIKGVLVRQERQISKDDKTGVETKVDYREFYATIGTQFRVEIATNATDAQVMTILAGLDVLAMNKLLTNPVAFINEDQPILTRDELQDREIKAAKAEEATAQTDASALAEVEAEGTAPLASDAAPTETATAEKDDSTFGGKGCVRRAGVLTCS